MALAKRIGHFPARTKDTPGFIANRILMPMINEAIYTLYEGVGTVDAIDTALAGSDPQGEHVGGAILVDKVEARSFALGRLIIDIDRPAIDLTHFPPDLHARFRRGGSREDASYQPVAVLIGQHGQAEPFRRVPRLLCLADRDLYGVDRIDMAVAERCKHLAENGVETLPVPRTERQRAESGWQRGARNDRRRALQVAEYKRGQQRLTAQP